MSSTHLIFPKGLFALCEGAWDDKEHKFVRNSLDEKMKCCLSSCEPDTLDCESICDEAYKNDKEKHRKCMNKCVRTLLTCRDTCNLLTMDYGKKDPFVVCSEKNKCGTFPNFRRDCLIQNRDSILTCCKHECKPGSGIDCRTHCDQKYTDYIDSTLLNKYFHDTKRVKKSKRAKKYTWIVYIAILIFCSLVFTFVLVK